MTTAMNEAEKLAERLRDIVTKYRFVSHEHGVIDGAAALLRSQAEQIKVLSGALEDLCKDVEDYFGAGKAGHNWPKYLDSAMFCARSAFAATKEAE